MSNMPSLSPRYKQGAADDWHSYKPMYFMAIYNDSATKMEHVVVIIIAPSGMCHGDLVKCHLQVEEDGKKLIISSQWPAYSMDMEVFHCNWRTSLPKTLTYAIFGSTPRPCQMSWL